MSLLSMKFRQKIIRVFGVVFLLSTMLGMSRELILAQGKVNNLGDILSASALPKLLMDSGQRHEIEKHLERYRISLRFDRLVLFDDTGRKLAESPAGGHTGGEEIHGVLTSARTGVRSSGREVAHLVVWRNMEAEVARPLLIGLIAALLASLIAWPIVSRKLDEEQPG